MASASEPPVCTAAHAVKVCLQPPASAPADVHSAARSILAQPQFHPASDNWLSRFLSWVGRGLADVIRWFFSGHGLSDAGLVLAGLLIVLAAFLAARFALRVQSDPAVRVHEDEVGRRPVDWRAEADSHAAAGDWRQALRCQYRALVAELAEREVVEEMPGRTAREYEQQVRANAPGVAAAFDEASDRFEAVWYGFEDCGPDDVSYFVGLAASVLDRRRAA